MSQVDFRDYYELLGVPRTATAEEIKTAYRRLARKYHPDVNPGDASAEARFKEINEANEVIELITDTFEGERRDNILKMYEYFKLLYHITFYKMAASISCFGRCFHHTIIIVSSR